MAAPSGCYAHKKVADPNIGVYNKRADKVHVPIGIISKKHFCNTKKEFSFYLEKRLIITEISV